MSKTFDRHVLPITSAVAAALLTTGCSRSNNDRADLANTDVRVCRDAQGRRVEDYNCHSRGGGAVGWYYLGRGSAVSRIGETQLGGAFSPASGKSYTQASPSTVTRGGLGLSGRSAFS